MKIRLTLILGSLFVFFIGMDASAADYPNLRSQWTPFWAFSSIIRAPGDELGNRRDAYEFDSMVIDGAKVRFRVTRMVQLHGDYDRSGLVWRAHGSPQTVEFDAGDFDHLLGLFRTAAHKKPGAPFGNYILPEDRAERPLMVGDQATGGAQQAFMSPLTYSPSTGEVGSRVLFHEHFEDFYNIWGTPFLSAREWRKFASEAPAHEHEWRMRTFALKHGGKFVPVVIEKTENGMDRIHRHITYKLASELAGGAEFPSTYHTEADKLYLITREKYDGSVNALSLDEQRKVAERVNYYTDPRYMNPQQRWVVPIYKPGVLHRAGRYVCKLLFGLL